MKKTLLTLSCCALFLYSLVFNICIAAETVDKDISNIIGMIINDNELFQRSKLSKKYQGVEPLHVIKHGIGKKGEPVHIALFELLHVKSSNEHYLWLLREREVIDAIKISFNNNHKIKVGYSKEHELKYSGFINPIFALINKSDKSVLKAWSTDIKEGKIQEIPVKGIYCYDDDCIMSPQNEHSSKEKCFGVSGWPLGKNCPNMELYWDMKESDSEESGNNYFRNSAGSVFQFPEGMAIFSPNCKYFWYTNYDHNPPEIKIFSTKTGKSVIKITGEYPAWSSDGESIYYFRAKNSNRQLWEFNFIDKKENLIIQVQDFLPCHQEDDEVEWYPVIISKKGFLIWTYWIKGSDGDYAGPVKRITIDAKKKAVLKVEYKDSWSCAGAAFETFD